MRLTTSICIFILIICLSSIGLYSQGLMDSIRLTHPRLILTSQQIDSVREWEKDDTLVQELMEVIYSYAESALTSPLIAYQYDGAGDPRLKRERRNAMFRVLNCGLVYQITGDTIYAARVRDELIAAAEFPDWGPQHYLNIGELSALCGIGYDWVHDFLTAEDKARIIPGLLKNGIYEGVKAYEGTHQDGWWVEVNNNWNQVCNGGLTLLALALAEEIPDTAEIIVNNAIQSITHAMESYVPEGAWHEGPTYWAYGTTYNAMLLSGLKTSFGNFRGLERDNGYLPLGKSGQFHIHTAGPTGLYFNYGDSKKILYYSPVLFWMAEEYNIPAYAWFERLTCRKDLPRMKSMVLMNDDTLDRFLALLIAWYSNAGQNISYNDFPHDEIISSGETVVGSMHSSWDEDAIYLGFKGGTPNTGHAHMDLGSFVFDAEGERWAFDLGGDDYDLPGYFDFSGPRWGYFRLNNYGHNTLTLMNRLQEKDAFANITHFFSDENYAYAELDLTSAYPDAGRVTRTFEMVDRERIIISDRIEQTFEYLPIRWKMITDADVILNQKEALLKKNGEVVKVKINSPADAVFSILSASPGNSKEASNDGSSILAVEYYVSNIVNTNIQIELIPNDTAFSIHAGMIKIEKTLLSLYPNPFSEEITIDLSPFSSKDIDYTLFDYFGRALNFGVWHSENSNLIKWNPTDRGCELKPGVYFLKIRDNNHTYTERLIKLSY